MINKLSGHICTNTGTQASWLLHVHVCLVKAVHSSSRVTVIPFDWFLILVQQAPHLGLPIAVEEDIPGSEVSVYEALEADVLHSSTHVPGKQRRQKCGVKK